MKWILIATWLANPTDPSVAAHGELRGEFPSAQSCAFAAASWATQSPSMGYEFTGFTCMREGK